MARPTSPSYSRLVAILLAVALALALGLLAKGNALPLLLGAVTLAAWFGGLRLGLETTILIVLLALMGVRDRERREARAASVVQIVNFAGVGLLITGLTEAFRMARRRAEGDATARRLSEERYRLAVRGSRDGIWDWDLRTGHVYRSARLEEMLGRWDDRPGEVMATFAKRLHPEDRDRVLAALRDHLERRFPYDIELRMEISGGEYRWFHACGQATWDHDGRATRMAGSLGDITARKRAEVQLLEAKEAAEAAGRSKDLFLAMLSHELRTPLTPALLGISGLLDDPETPRALRPTLETAARGIALEARLVDDLLDVTRIGAGKLQIHPERVDAHAIVAQVVDACRGDLASAGVQLELDLGAADHHVEADPARLQQVLWNLLKNAVKFTSAGTIAIRTRNLAECGCRTGVPCLNIAVQDTGIGIESDLLPRVFDAFEQGEPGRRRRSGGLGLGLAICRSIAEAHGGHLTVTSEGPGRGSTFTLELAVSAPAESRMRAIDPVADDHGRLAAALRLLLVEDDEDTARIMARLLRSRGAEVTTAATLEQAKEAATGRPFDLLISDIGLPDGSGLDLVRWLRTRGRVPAIALTGFGMDEDVRRCREAGFDAHLTKPIDFRHLESVIREFARRDSRDS